MEERAPVIPPTPRNPSDGREQFFSNAPWWVLLSVLVWASALGSGLRGHVRFPPRSMLSVSAQGSEQAAHPRREVAVRLLPRSAASPGSLLCQEQQMAGSSLASHSPKPGVLVRCGRVHRPSLLVVFFTVPLCTSALPSLSVWWIALVACWNPEVRALPLQRWFLSQARSRLCDLDFSDVQSPQERILAVTMLERCRFVDCDSLCGLGSWFLSSESW